VLPPAPVAVAAAVAPNADAAADRAVAVDAMSAARFQRSDPGTTSCRQADGKTHADTAFLLLHMASAVIAAVA
jgi:hypothetical protein